MIQSDSNENRIKRSFRRLSTVREDSQEIFIEQDQYDITKGILFI